MKSKSNRIPALVCCLCFCFPALGLVACGGNESPDKQESESSVTTLDTTKGETRPVDSDTQPAESETCPLESEPPSVESEM